MSAHDWRADCRVYRQALGRWLAAKEEGWPRRDMMMLAALAAALLQRMPDPDAAPPARRPRVWGDLEVK